MYGTFTLTGRHTTPSGKPHAGSVVITPNATIRDTAGDVVMSGAEQVKLDETGAWSIVLPCDSPELNPSEGIGYSVGYSLYSTAMTRQSFYATADMAGSTLDMSDIVTVSVPAPLSAIVGPQGEPGDTSVADAAALAAQAAAEAAESAAPRSLATYGVLPTNTPDQNRAGFRAAAASEYHDFVLNPGTYQWSAEFEGDWMMTFTGASKVRIRGNGAVINDTTTYTNQGAFTGLFLLDGCKDFEVSGIEYVGPALASPTTQLGYQGAMIVRAVNGTDGVKVDMRVTNARYAVQTGDYADGSKGNCKNFDLKLRTSFCGYPFAGYLAEGIRLDIDADDLHRGAYIAGCNDVRGVVRFKNQYIADAVTLITDALVSGSDTAAQADPVGAATVSRGCRNIDLATIDKGSTITQPNTMCAAFNVSRVDPVVHSDIRLKVFTVSTNTVSRYVGGFRIFSDAKTVWSRYPFNIEPAVVFQNITVSGVVDHSAQTVSGNTAGDVYVFAYDTSAAHAATIRNFRIDGMTIHKSAGGLRASYFFAPGLADVATLTNVVSPAVDWNVFTNGTSTVRFQGSKIATLDSGTSLVAAVDSSVNAITTASSNVTVSNSTASGAGMLFKQKSVTLSLSGASTSWASAIPAGSLVFAVQGIVTTDVAGATGYQVGVVGDVSRYVNTNTLTTGSTFGPTNQAATEAAPRYYVSATNLIVTAKTSNFTAGSLRLVLTYATFPAPSA